MIPRLHTFVFFLIEGYRVLPEVKNTSNGLHFFSIQGVYSLLFSSCSVEIQRTIIPYIHVRVKHWKLTTSQTALNLDLVFVHLSPVCHSHNSVLLNLPSLFMPRIQGISPKMLLRGIFSPLVEFAFKSVGQFLHIPSLPLVMHDTKSSEIVRCICP